MIILKNEYLSVSILDPRADRRRFGSRYCTGGYIWQITDNNNIELLSGPAYPDPNPPIFDGQGFPEVFETALDQSKALVGEELLVLGVGRVLRTSPVTPFHVRDNPVVVSFCEWRIDEEPDRVVMTTEQRFGNFAIELVREVKLDKRSIASSTKVINQGTETVPLRWFAHPFFPHPEDGICCRFSIPVNVPENPGFFMNRENFLQMNPDHQWEKGCYRPLETQWGKKITIEQRHPVTGSVLINLGFPLAWMPVWGNKATFSFEPYFSAELTEGKEANWFISYQF